jgi:hypothetical protein
MGEIVPSASLAIVAACKQQRIFVIQPIGLFAMFIAITMRNVDLAVSVRTIVERYT